MRANIRQGVRAATLSIAVLFALAATGTAEEMALGRDGQLLRLRTLSSAEAFGPVADLTAEDPVLAVEIVKEGAATRLLVVPGTEGPEVERSAYLAYENSSDTIFVTWERRSNSIHSQIFLASYRGGEWAELIPVSDQRFSLKSSPKIAITREAYSLPSSESVAKESRVQRTTLHVVWFEERGTGAAIVYAPIILVDGDYVGSHSRLTLSELFPAEAGSTADAAPASIVPTIRATSDRRSVVVGFVDPWTGQLVTSRVSLLTGELAVLSGEARSHIIDIGGRYDSREPGALQRLADEARSHIIDIGSSMDRPLVRFIADEARSHIIDIGARYDSRDPSSLRRLADEARSHIIDIGFRLDARGVPRRSDAQAITLELGDRQASIANVVRVEQPMARQLPEIAADSADLHLSGTGEHALIAWQAGGELRYRETTDMGWGEVRSLALSEHLTPKMAVDVLREHLDGR